MKYFLFGVLLAMLGGFGYWVIAYSEWFSSSEIPNNPPTAEELSRMKAVEEASMRPNPDAKPGAGVRPVGTLPKNPVPTDEASSSEPTTEEDTAVTEPTTQL